MNTLRQAVQEYLALRRSLGFKLRDAEQHASGAKDLQSWRCPKCGGPMRVIQRFTAAELQLRSPPTVCAAA